MSNVIRFETSKDEYMKLTSHALQDGDIVLATDFLKDALKSDAGFVEASIMLSDIYASLGVYSIANAVLFRALTQSPEEREREAILFCIGRHFSELDMPDVAAYYSEAFCEFDDGESERDFLANLEESYRTDDAYKVIYPRGDSYYHGIMAEASLLIDKKQFIEARLLLDAIPKKSTYYETARQLNMMCLMIANDISGVIDEAKMLLNENDNVNMKCTLATAYLMKESMSEANEIIDDILSKEYSKIEDILVVLPVLVNANRHNEVLKYTKRALNSCNYQPNIMLWLSQAYYNTGDAREALRTIYTVKRMYGEFIDADYYISLFESGPEKVEYCVDVPVSEKIARFDRFDKYMRLSDEKFSDVAEDNAKFQRLVNWVFKSGNDDVIEIVARRLSTVHAEWIKDLFTETLLDGELDFEVMSHCINYLMDNYGVKEFNIVAQDRFKNVRIEFPQNFEKYPSVLKIAYKTAIFDIIYTDEEPGLYLRRLASELEDITSVSEDGKINFKYCDTKAFSRMRSAITLTGVIVAKVYEGDEQPCTDSVIRYTLKPATFDKYFLLMFGVEDMLEKEDAEYVDSLYEADLIEK